MKKTRNHADMLKGYDFSRGVRGKYAKQYAEGSNIVVIDPDVAEYFPDHDSVNESLRSLVSIKRDRRKPGVAPNGDVVILAQPEM